MYVFLGRRDDSGKGIERDSHTYQSTAQGYPQMQGNHRCKHPFLQDGSRGVGGGLPLDTVKPMTESTIRPAPLSW